MDRQYNKLFVILRNYEFDAYAEEAKVERERQKAIKREAKKYEAKKKRDIRIKKKELIMKIVKDAVRSIVALSATHAENNLQAKDQAFSDRSESQLVSQGSLISIDNDSIAFENNSSCSVEEDELGLHSQIFSISSLEKEEETIWRRICWKTRAIRRYVPILSHVF